MILNFQYASWFQQFLLINSFTESEPSNCLCFGRRWLLRCSWKLTLAPRFPTVPNQGANSIIIETWAETTVSTARVRQRFFARQGNLISSHAARVKAWRQLETTAARKGISSTKGSSWSFQRNHVESRLEVSVLWCVIVFYMCSDDSTTFSKVSPVAISPALTATLAISELWSSQRQPRSLEMGQAATCESNIV